MKLAPEESAAYSDAVLGATIRLERSIVGRRSVRQFRDAAVPIELLERMLEAARWAPSPHNAQPWRFAVVVGRETKVRLSEAMAARFQEDLLRDGHLQEAVERRVRTSISRLSKAPALILASIDPDGLHAYPDGVRQDAEKTMAAQSIGAALQNMLLAAEALGLGTCWLCAPLFCPEVASAVLDLNPAWQPQALVLVGYPAHRPAAPRRRPLDSIVVYR